jgi:hypothetical protein
MASDFLAAWQCLSKRTIVFFRYGSSSTPTFFIFVALYREDNFSLAFWVKIIEGYL